jgi:TorA maturation chaperone TorD
MTHREADPPIELLRALAVLCEPPAPEHARVAEALGLAQTPDGADFAETFLFRLYPYASVYLGPEGMLGGEARERVAGFWRAVGRVPPDEPDHLGALVGLYAGLLDEGFRSEGAEAEIARQAATALLFEHVAPWVFDYLDRVEALGGSSYGAWADLLSRTLGAEMARAGAPAGLPVHLFEAPSLADPREEGGQAFLSGLLAPVRTGVILTRSDFGRLAKAENLGLRMGERRYVLEHLLAQEPSTVLRALAVEAEEARARHAGRRAMLGSVASFWEDRAAKTGVLLHQLATEGERILGELQEAGP